MNCEDNVVDSFCYHDILGPVAEITEVGTHDLAIFQF